jgi:glycosyltransferase involved in cell wall biosynthesis
VRILFVHNALRNFVRVDRDILASAHKVDELDLSRFSRIASLPYRLRKADMVYAWFASLHSLGPALGASVLGKPSIVVMGGYDTACMPEIGYGSMAHPLKRHVVRLICHSATALIVNSHAAAEDVRHNVGDRTPVYVIYHGFEAPQLPLRVRRDPIVLTVGNISRESLKRKGHEAFVQSASLVPDACFILAGRCYDDTGERLRSIAPSNLALPGFLSQSALDDLFARTSVYVQPSAHEGFGCAVAEAMIAGCFPVVSHRGALPEVVGEHGIFVDESNPVDIAHGIQKALSSSPEERQAIASCIANRFSLSRRRDTLLRLVSSLDSDKRASAHSK